MDKIDTIEKLLQAFYSNSKIDNCGELYMHHYLAVRLINEFRQSIQDRIAELKQEGIFANPLSGENKFYKQREIDELNHIIGGK